MLIAVILALALIVGQHPASVGILALAFVAPPAFLLTAALWAGYHALDRARIRRQLPAAEADFLRGVAGEVDAGASVRQAVIAAADRAPNLDLSRVVAMAAAGRPAVEVAGRLQIALPLNGRMTASAYQLVAATGARASAVFAGLATRAADAGDLERERRALTAQTRMSAWMVGGLPAAVTVGMALAGRGPDLDGPGGLVAAVGVGLIALGGSVVWLMVRSS